MSSETKWKFNLVVIDPLEPARAFTAPAQLCDQGITVGSCAEEDLDSERT